MCGIFVWSGKDKNDFDWTKFNTLGLFNDSRGGDSCGRTHGDYRLVGTGKDEEYKDLVLKYNNENLVGKSILGHTRKASVGVVSEGTAQPVVIKDNNGSILFKLVHNGTIYNYEELADKYGVDHNNKTDSQVLAEIIYNNGPNEVLSEYIGAAAIVYTYNNEDIYIFKGASKATAYSTEEKEERPLFLYQEKEDSVYLSSLEDSLFFIGGDKDTVIDLKTNKLICVSKGKITGVSEISRSDAFYKKPYKSSNSSTTKYSNNYEEYDDDYYRNKYGYDFNYENNSNNNLIDESKSKSIFLEKFRPENNSKILISYVKGRYFIGKDLANGIYYVHKLGYICSEDKPIDKIKDDDNFNKYYFLRGVMIDGHSNFNKVNKMIKKSRNKSFFKNHFASESEKIFNELLKVSKYPIQRITVRSRNNTRTGYMKVNGNINTNTYLTGEITPVFSKYKYEYNYGNFVKKTNIVTSKELVKASTSNETSTLDIQKEMSSGSLEEFKNNIDKDSHNLFEDGHEDLLCINDTSDIENDVSDALILDEIRNVFNKIDAYVSDFERELSHIGDCKEVSEASANLASIREFISESY